MYEVHIKRLRLDVYETAIETLDGMLFQMNGNPIKMSAGTR